MRKALCFLILLTLLSQVSYSASVTRKMPSDAEPGSTIEVIFRAASLKPGALFTLEETRPLQTEITDWDVIGANEEKSKIETRQKDLGYGWSFTPNGTEATIKYSAKVSEKATGPLLFEAVYFDPDGFDKAQGTLNVARKQPAVIKGDIVSPIDEESVNKSDKTDKVSDDGKQLAGVKRAKPVLTAVILAVVIIIAGIGIYLYTTRPRRRRDMFTHSFFKK